MNATATNRIADMRKHCTVTPKASPAATRSVPFLRNIFFAIGLLCAPLVAEASVCETVWDGEKIVASLSGLPSNLRIPLKDKNQNSKEVTLAQVRAFHDAKNRISRVVGLSPAFILCGDSSPNAFAGPGPNGPVVGVTLGMLRLADGDADMAAAVIGHEFAHHVKQHGSASQTRNAVIGMIGLVAGIALEYNLQKKQGVTGLGLDVGTMGANLTSRKFDRDQEREADDLGFQYMIAAGFNPTGALRLAERFSQLGRGEGGWFYDSHPGWNERGDLLRAKIANSPEARQIIAKGSGSATITTVTQSTFPEASAAFLPTNQPMDAQRVFQTGVAAYQEGNYAKALEQFKRSADLNYPLAKWSVGSLFEKGQGTSANLTEANSWYRKAAEQGVINAQLSLGYNLATGRGVAKDEVEAVTWFRRAADQGFAPAQNNVGISYASGRGVAKDDAEAVTWFRRAADQGFAPAQANLGYHYSSGRGVAKDDAEAVTWFRKAAEQGHSQAQNSLGLHYATGRGVAKDDAEAVKWYRKAAEQGNAAAAVALRKLAPASN